MLPWAWLYKHLFETLLSIILGIYPEVELRDHMIITFLSSWGTAVSFCTMVVPFDIPTFWWEYTWVSISPHPHQYLLISVFLIVAIVMYVRWYLLVVLIYISLMISDVQHLFLCLLAICMSSLKRCLLEFLAHFWTCFFGCCEFWVFSVYSEYNPFQIYDLQMFSPILCVTFLLNWWCCLMHSILKFSWSLVCLFFLLLPVPLTSYPRSRCQI